ncbi:DUF31 family putative serine protease [[Mycoplasma] testudinis]|uniref:DUF31 family putative serine protease n=1 Tax=[Mycoplasma] testudinis TaxID=33924 RepID=UPI000484AEF8|nr:hypothetical protein [[Mycoplasma] testudinis]
MSKSTCKKTQSSNIFEPKKDNIFRVTSRDKKNIFLQSYKVNRKKKLLITYLSASTSFLAAIIIIVPSVVVSVQRSNNQKISSAEASSDLPNKNLDPIQPNTPLSKPSNPFISPVKPSQPTKPETPVKPLNPTVTKPEPVTPSQPVKPVAPANPPQRQTPAFDANLVRHPTNFTDFNNPVSTAINPYATPKEHYQLANQQAIEIEKNTSFSKTNAAFKTGDNYQSNDLTRSNQGLFYDARKIANNNSDDEVTNALLRNQTNIPPKPLKPLSELVELANSNNTPISFNRVVLDYLITHNEFGQSPSMFAWKLLTLSDEFRNNLLSVNGQVLFKVSGNQTISNVLFYADDINDHTGVLDLYISYDLNKIHQASRIQLNQTNSALKKDGDYLKYINERSFLITYDFVGWNQNTDNHFNQTGSINYDNRKSATGTGWIVDEINDSSLEAGKVAFVVATNKHVLDFTLPTLADQNSANTETGLSSQQLQQQEFFNSHQGFLNFSWTHHDFDNYDNLANITATNTSRKPSFAQQEFNQYTAHPVVNIADNSSSLASLPPAQFSQAVTKTKQNFLNSFLYVPDFSLQNTSATLGMNATANIQKNFIKDNVTYNAGPDLVLMRMEFNLKDLKQSWPSLYAVVSSNDQTLKTNWFPGLGTNDAVTDNRVISYVLGYPLAPYNRDENVLSYRIIQNSLSFGSRRKYTVGENDIDNTLQTILRNYDSKFVSNFNLKRSENTNKYPYDDVFSSPMNGLRYQTLNIGSTMLFTGPHLLSGNSGAMVIDSNFNPIGIAYQFQTYQDFNNGQTSSVAMFVQQDQNAISNVTNTVGVSVNNDFQQILKNHQIATFRLNPKK